MAGPPTPAVSDGRFVKSQADGWAWACVLQIWSGLHIGTVVKHTVNKTTPRGGARQPEPWQSRPGAAPFAALAGGQVLNTSFIERFNGTMRERLATLTRKCRHAAHRLQTLETGMYLVGSTYNFCCAHQALEQRTRPRSAWPAETVRLRWQAG